MLWRIMSLAQPRVLVVTALVAGVIVGIVAINRQWAAAVQQTLLVMPDDVHINGSLVTLTARDQQSQAKETVILRAREPAELRRLRMVDHPALWHVTGTLQPLVPATNDQQFDRRFYYQQHHIYNELRVKELGKVQPQPIRGWRSLCHVIRYRLIEYFKTMPQLLGACCLTSAVSLATCCR